MNKSTLCPHFPWDFPGPTPGAGAEEGPSRQSSGCRPGSLSASQPSGRRGSKVRVTSGLLATRHPDNQLKGRKKKKTPANRKGRKHSDHLAISVRPAPAFRAWAPRPALARLPCSWSAGPDLKESGSCGWGTCRIQSSAGSGTGAWRTPW